MFCDSQLSHSSTEIQLSNGQRCYRRQEGETNLASISGLLCLSTTCDEKFSSVNAAVNVARTALRYGLKVLDCRVSDQSCRRVLSENLPHSPS